MLMITRSAAHLPPTTTTLDAWTAAARRCWRDGADDSGIALYRGLLDIMYAPTGIAPAALAGDAATIDQNLSFPVAGGETQTDLGGIALAQLMPDAPRGACDLAVYATTSVDEAFYTSSIGRLAAEAGLSALPHFALQQLHGASLAGAVEIIGAMLPAGGSAVFVAAEKWPMPAPRVVDGACVLGDGAVALALRADGPAGGLAICDVVNASHPPFAALTDGMLVIDHAAFAAAATATVRTLLERSGPAVGRRFWLPSGHGSALDAAVSAPFGGTVLADPAATIDPRIHLGCAAAPFGVHRALQAWSAGQVRDGDELVAWGCSFGGAVGALLLRFVPEARQ